MEKLKTLYVADRKEWRAALHAKKFEKRFLSGKQGEDCMASKKEYAAPVDSGER